MAPSAACTLRATLAASPIRDTRCCCTNDVTTLSGTLPTLTRTVRDRIVGSKASGSLVVGTMNAARRRLLEGLEDGVGRSVLPLLGRQPLGVAQDEYRP